MQEQTPAAEANDHAPRVGLSCKNVSIRILRQPFESCPSRVPRVPAISELNLL